MSIVLLVMTDGRQDCITQTIASAEANLTGPISRRVIHDDSADPRYRTWLHETFPTYEVIGQPKRQGFGGAIRSAWNYLLLGDEQFIMHLEDDFTFNRSVDLAAMAGVLNAYPHIVQLALRRQPWNDEERAAGGIVDLHFDDYTEKRLDQAVNFLGEKDAPPDRWLEHRRFFTTNPSLYRRELCSRSWPDGPESEGHFSAELFSEPSSRCGFWGSRDSGEAVTHIGNERVGVGY